MASIALGQIPDDLAITLVRGADFIASISTRDSSDWPDGLIVTVAFDDEDSTVFTADVTGPTIAFDVDKAIVETLIDATPRLARLFYIDGDTDLLWAVGRPRFRG